MATNRTRPALDDVSEAGAQRLHLSPAVSEAGAQRFRAAIDRALSVSEAGAQRLHGITLSTDVSEAGAQRLLAALLATGGDDEVRDLLAQPARSAIAAGRVAETIGVARFNQAEAAFNWDEPRNRPLPLDDQ